MYIRKTGHWADSLRQTLERVNDPTTRTPVPWLLSGDAALAVQGVAIEPEVIEFRAMSAVATAYFAQFMRPFEAPAGAATIVYRRGGNMAPSESWRSNIHQRIVAWSVGGRATWLGRWYVDGVTVEVSYVTSIHPDPVAAAFKAATPTRRARFGDTDTAVVPLEYGLAESALGKDQPLTQRILQTLRARGHNSDDLKAALATLPSDKAARLTRLLEFTLIAG